MNRNPVSVPTRPLHIIHTEASLGWGGQEIRILTEAAGMQQRGHTVTLLAPAAARIYQEAPRFGLKVIDLPLAKKQLKGVCALRSYLTQHRVDVVNSHSSTDSWLAALALTTISRAPPLVRTRHISAPITTNFSTRWLYRKATQRIVTTGESIRAYLITTLGLDPNRVVSIPTGVDPTVYQAAELGKDLVRQQLGLSPDKKWIGIVATLRSWKGHRFLVDAFARLAPSDPSLALIIIGEGPQRAALTTQIAQLGLTDRIQLVGNQNQVAPWLQALDLFVLPSYANEGVPQALLQAMMTGLPCITTQAGAIGEIAKPMTTAYVVPEQNSVALAEALHRLIAQPDVGQQLGTAARQYVQTRFTTTHMLDQMETLFYEVSSASTLRPSTTI